MNVRSLSLSLSLSGLIVSNSMVSSLLMSSLVLTGEFGLGKYTFESSGVLNTESSRNENVESSSLRVIYCLPM